MIGYLKRIATRNKWVVIAYAALSGVRTRRRFSGGNIASSGGSSHSHLTLEASVAYIEHVFDEYVKFGRLHKSDIEGRTVLELGVGDNIGVGLRFLACGARQYTALDRFYSVRDAEAERRIYLALRERLAADEIARFDQALNLHDGIHADEARIRLVYGHGAEEADRVFAGEKFDFIISRAVIHEVYAIDRAFAAMDALLAPGGMLLHKIDLRDYGMLSAWGFHPREYLTIPRWIYRQMVEDCGKPNRKLIDYYRRKMQELGYDAELFITCVLDPSGYRGVQEEFDPFRSEIRFGSEYFEVHRKLIDRIRPRLGPEFRGLSEQDLLAASVFLAARKPDRVLR